jgi:hypothetical protein
MGRAEPRCNSRAMRPMQQIGGNAVKNACEAGAGLRQGMSTAAQTGCLAPLDHPYPVVHDASPGTSPWQKQAEPGASFRQEDLASSIWVIVRQRRRRRHDIGTQPAGQRLTGRPVRHYSPALIFAFGSPGYG